MENSRTGRKDRLGRKVKKGLEKKRMGEERYEEKSGKGKVEGSQVGGCQKIPTEIMGGKYTRKGRKNKKKEGHVCSKKRRAEEVKETGKNGERQRIDW